MKTKLRFALPALVVLSVVGVAWSFKSNSASASPGSAGGASAASTSSGANVFSALRPDAWIYPPFNVTHSPLYDQGPGPVGISSSQTDNTVTVVFGRANNSTGDGLVIASSNNPALGGNFGEQVLSSSCVGCNGAVKTRSDALGRRHVVWWEQNGSTVCDYYALIEANGQVSANEGVPNTCGLSRKNTALAVSPDGTVHAFFQNNNLDNIYYYERLTTGLWAIQGEQITITRPGDITAAITTLGVPMVGWKGESPGGNSDIYTATRNANGTWTTEDISYDCCLQCPTNSRAYLPALARDSLGGLRMSWSDEHCDSRSNPPSQDIYYREWVPGTGWNNQPIVRVVNDIGYSYQSTIAMDATGRAYIAWGDTVGTAGSFVLAYSSGRGTTFDPPTMPFLGWGTFQKDIGIDTGPGYAHLTFSSDRDDHTNKDNYYSYNVTGPPPPTSTPTATFTPTRTPTPRYTPTPCTAGRYSDVFLNDYYYAAALELGQRGIMSGYSDCTFRPGYNITRGQTTKIVVLGAELPINTAGGPHFSDVHPGDTFYDYIETAYNAGIVNGYADGTFRPQNNVTRGQFCKMVVQAFQIPINTLGGPHFSDVTTTHTFYQYIETAYNSGLITGYQDGTFRPGNNLTRGQGAKIVYLARHLPEAATPTQTAIALTSTPTVPPATNTSIPTLTATSTSIPTLTVTSTPTSVQ